MKAITYEKYGTPDVLKLSDIDRPAPKAGEVLIKVRATAVNARDWRLLSADPFLVRLMGSGLLKPKYRSIGSDVAGIIEAVGSDVTRLKAGDEVFGDICGAGFGGGGFAEYVCAPEKALVLKPIGLSFEQAAAIPMACVTALQGLRNVGRLQSGEQVLIAGASGGVGTFAVQLAKAFGAEVTAVCSTGKVELARSLGAGTVIDYTKEDFAAGDRRYDLILAANGNRSLGDYRRALKLNGRYVMAGGEAAQLFQALLFGSLVSMAGTQKTQVLSAHPNAADLALIVDLFKAGKVVPVIDRRYPLEETADAVRYVQAGHAAGKVIVTVD